MKNKSLIALLLSVVFLALMAGCTATGTNGESEDAEDGSVSVSNPVATYDSLEEAETVAGFSFAIPEGVNIGGADYPQYYWSTIGGTLIEVRYGGEGDEVCYLRKAATAETTGDLAHSEIITDISGDYNVYEEVKEVDITLEDGRDATVTLKGQNEKFYLAIWQLRGTTDNGLWNYAIGIRGVSEEDLLELVKMVE